MGFFDGGRSQSYSGTTRGYSPARSGYSSKSIGGSRSHSQNHSRSQSQSGGAAHFTRPSYARSSSSFFGNTSHSQSRSPWFGSSKSSYYGRRSRDGYVKYLMQKLQRMVRELWYYMRKNPVKAFFAVIVPLLSAGGAISGLLKNFGVRLPFNLGGGGRSGYSSRSYSKSYSGGGRGGAGWGGTMGSMMQIARAFA